MAYFLSDAAADDLDGIWFDGVTRWDVAQADRYHQKILDILVFLGENPKIGRVRDDLDGEYLSYPIGSHRVFYRCYEGTIKVIRVLHQRMDFQLHLMS